MAAAEVKIARLQSEFNEYRRHHEVLLHKLENVGEKITKLLNTNGELESKLKFAEKKAERNENENGRLKEQVLTLKAKISEIDTAIAVGPVDVKETFELKAKIAKLEEENKKMKDRVLSKNNDTDYMRIEYQKASSAAAEAHTELIEMRQANAELKRKADGEVCLLRAMQFDSERTARDDKISEMAFRIENLEEHIRKLETEKQQMRGRYGVRSSSVPRRTMSPSMSSVSRGGSPSNTPFNNTNHNSASSHPLQTVTKIE